MAATAYKTPGVYVEEISRLPPSVSEVSTAIPAFIGYTQKRGDITDNGSVIVHRISTMLEYEQYFGRPQSAVFTVMVDTTKNVTAISRLKSDAKTAADELPEFLMYYALSHYFGNGGGRCYVISIGDYTKGASPDVKHYQAGLKTLEKEDEPTLVVLPDAVRLTSEYYGLCGEVLAQCKNLGDRFSILDVVPNGDLKNTADQFRTGVSVDTEYRGYGAGYYPYLETSMPHIYDESSSVIVDISGTDSHEYLVNLPKAGHNILYNQIKSLLAEQRVTLPPSAAVAGIYARVDRDRGVWKAPANVSVQGVIGPVTKISDEDQKDLNEPDDGSGKSINAIRAFAGKGTLV